MDPWGAVHAALGLAAPNWDGDHHADMLALVDRYFGLRQCDLPEVGAQSVVPAVLAANAR